MSSEIVKRRWDKNGRLITFGVICIHLVIFSDFLKLGN